MMRLAKKVYSYSLLLGFDPRRLFVTLTRMPIFFKQYWQFKKNNKNALFPISSFYPCLAGQGEAGIARGHYFHQDLWVARQVFNNKPQKHVDIGSRIDGVVAHIASFRKIEVFDIRQIDSQVDGVIFQQVDCMKMAENWTNYCDSISSLHAIEHFGLGRYGDELDGDGYLKGLENIHQLLKPQGRFYFSVPIGKQRIEFNAHRVFSLDYLITLLTPNYHIDCFCYVNDSGALITDVDLFDKSKVRRNFDCHYGCGIFSLIKK